VVTPRDFRCTGCGNCCRDLRVAVTARDVARLARATGLSGTELVEWLAPHEVDMTGEPESFVTLAEGRHLMVLAQHDGACRLLGADDRCQAYAARPRDCRAFPFDVEPGVDGVRRLTLLPLGRCEYAEDGDNDAATLEAEDDARHRELAEYQARVGQWNRKAWHRERLQKRLRSAAEFLTEVVRELEPGDPDVST
jgi:Fe-S-cluster containining protein